MLVIYLTWSSNTHTKLIRVGFGSQRLLGGFKSCDKWLQQVLTRTFVLFWCIFVCTPIRQRLICLPCFLVVHCHCIFHSLRQFLERFSGSGIVPTEFIDRILRQMEDSSRFSSPFCEICPTKDCSHRLSRGLGWFALWDQLLIPSMLSSFKHVRFIEKRFLFWPRSLWYWRFQKDF